MRGRSCPAVAPANSRQKLQSKMWRTQGSKAISLAVILVMAGCVSAGSHRQGERSRSHPGRARPAVDSLGSATTTAAAGAAAAAGAGAAGPTGSHTDDSQDAARAATTPSSPISHHGRSLQQLGYDPYGIGYYDPYQSGVTPGFINVDLNRETGLHVDVGTVAVDVSADKNYYGLGVGNLVGVGAAKDRGWNLQLGGGNILDVSVTKDAGLGLWLLNGLANIQIGPDGRGWETGHIAAQGVPGQPAVATAGAAQPAQQQVTSVVVDESRTGSDDGGASKPAAAAAADDDVVHVSSTSAAETAEEPIITEEPINLSLSSAPELTKPGMTAPTGLPRSNAARRSRPPTYVEPRPAVVESVPDATVSLAAAGNDGIVASTYAAAEPAAAAWAAASSQTAEQPAAATVAAGLPVAPNHVGRSTGPVLQAAERTVATTPVMPRRACEGGAMVAAAGNKFKCRYRRTQPTTTSSSVVSTRPVGVTG